MPEIRERSANWNGKPSPSITVMPQRATAARELPDEPAMLEHLEGVKETGNGWLALCPAHDDNNPSLSIAVGDDGRTLLNCFAGCPTEKIVAALGMQMTDLFSKAGKGKSHVAKKTYPTCEAAICAIEYFKGESTACWEYMDAASKHVASVVRWDHDGKKDFRPISKYGDVWQISDPPGAWPVYRLRELIGDSKSIIVVCEGEKCANAAAKLDFIATTSAHGAKSARKTDWSPLAGREVVVIPDQDEPGAKYAHDVAAIVTTLDPPARVRIVKLPDLDDGEDIVEFVTKRRATGACDDEIAAEITALAEAEEPYDPTGRQDDGTTSRGIVGSEPYGSGNEPSSCSVVGSVVPVEPFPIEAFPEPLQTLVRSAAVALPCPPDFVGAMMLAVLSVCIGRRAAVQVKPGWVEYATLWIAVVARSGDRKSPAFELVTEVLRARQREFLAVYSRQKQAYERLSPEAKESASKPQLQQLLTTDSTIEGLKAVLAGNPLGIIFLADELAGWARAQSQYKGGRGDDRQHWLSIWSGTQIVCNRKGADTIIINDPFVSVTGGIQPDALGDLIDDAREDGFSARLLFAYPDPINNVEWSEAVVEGKPEYGAVCKWLLDQPKAAKPFPFSPPAKARWVAWVNEHRHEEPPPPDNLRATWSKAEGHCARIALVLFMARRACNEAKGDEIDVESIEGAICLITYFKSHARRAYWSAGDLKDEGRIGRALQWIKRHGGAVTARMANQYGLVQGSEAGAKLFDDLAELGYGTVTRAARRSVVFRLHADTQRHDAVPDEARG